MNTSHAAIPAIYMSGIIYLTKVRVSALLLYWEKNREKMWCGKVEYNLHCIFFRVAPEKMMGCEITNFRGESVRQPVRPSERRAPHSSGLPRRGSARRRHRSQN